MARESELLTARTVATRKEPGRYHDGLGLYLQVGPTGTKSWLFRYGAGSALSKEGKSYVRVREMGLGPVHTVSLAEAREECRKCRQQLLQGFDPIDTRNQAREARRLASAAAKSFQDCAADYIDAHRTEWRNAKHAAQWESTLQAYAYSKMGRLPVGAIDTSHVVDVLKPIWLTKRETAARLRGRIETILNYAVASKCRAEGPNPARWRGHLDQILAKRIKASDRKHHAALPFAELPAFVRDLRKQEGIAARALEYLILTVARTGETIGAQWPEVDLGAMNWTVPKERMKGGRPHRVPLADRAMEILLEMRPDEGSDFIFPGRGDGPLSNMACLMLLQRMGREDLTVHGFRSTFRDWAGETTNFPREVIEMALAHRIAGKTEEAYWRGDLYEKRRKLMEAWARFIEKPAATVHAIDDRRHAKK